MLTGTTIGGRSRRLATLFRNYLVAVDRNPEIHQLDMEQVMNVVENIGSQELYRLTAATGQDQEVARK